MKCVFFDSESVDRAHKVSFSFGYIVTDENFNVLNPSNEFVFNPDIPQNGWDWYAYNHILKNSFPKNELLQAEKFPYFYEQIKTLIEGEDTLCIGFAMQEDVKYLLGNCSKYNLDLIKFKYIDIRDVIRILRGKESKSLNNEFKDYYNNAITNEHTGAGDAEATMLVLKAVLNKYNKQLVQILDENKRLIKTTYGKQTEKHMLQR